MHPAEDPKRLSLALFAWANASSKGVRYGGSALELPDLVLHHRPDPAAPEVQLRLRATEHAGRPMIQVEYVPDEFGLPTPPFDITIDQTDEWSDTGEPPRNASATCDACGTVGTAGWITEDAADGATMTYRYCAECWGPEVAWHRARFERDNRRAALERMRSESAAEQPRRRQLSMRAATWHATLELVRGVEVMMHPQVPPSRYDLAALADHCSAIASTLDGPMPFEVEAFIRRYRAGEQ
jgi:hypothetical protein